ncbi:methyl-CpG-binding domain protein 6-like isoform X2 [Tympanuchus pallidicinctus]|uniref:methyl-CpG-binding domain protein 6-like isoform X2 n=1 Tax=Tympanuchus pallidicinctus TaxID=109042 RepID=UPI0022873362|nr:methyl-CpG-binding domain protein 6-like isoform X2 [Tympanuchus pallidicinctus]
MGRRLGWRSITAIMESPTGIPEIPVAASSSPSSLLLLRSLSRHTCSVTRVPLNTPDPEPDLSPWLSYQQAPSPLHSLGLSKQSPTQAWISEPHTPTRSSSWSCSESYGKPGSLGAPLPTATGAAGALGSAGTSREPPAQEPPRIHLRVWMDVLGAGTSQLPVGSISMDIGECCSATAAPPPLQVLASGPWARAPLGSWAQPRTLGSPRRRPFPLRAPCPLPPPRPKAKGTVRVEAAPGGDEEREAGKRPAERGAPPARERSPSSVALRRDGGEHRNGEGREAELLGGDGTSVPARKRREKQRCSSSRGDLLVLPRGDGQR